MNRQTKINELRRDKQDVIKLKRMSEKKSDSFSFSTNKIDGSFESKATKEDTEDVIYRKIVANTYYFLDSHDDVHVKGIFTKTLKENNPFFLHDHKFETTAKLGEVLASEEKQIAWKELGLNASGNTISLVHDVSIEKARNEALFNDYKNNNINQHSVGMAYVKIDLALDDKDDKDAFALYNKVLPELGNSEKAEKQGYFFVVSEAKLRETSAVLLGSNSLTGVLDSDKSYLYTNELQKLISNIDNKEIVYNICKNVLDTLDYEPDNSTPDNEPSDFETQRKNLLLKLSKL